MSKKHTYKHALNPPPLADTNPDAIEVLRVWAISGCPQEFTILPTWEDPGAWGLLLVDIARRAAIAYAKDGHDTQEVLARIRQLFDAEWAQPTDKARGVSN